ncbi:hypothetical protein [Nocardia seriolae]|uniref:Uncharacterized protein n=1 Tax=Nocardia seriolae TaxID=37332 RepID=A0ABC9YVY1_9NOCA|nr:hypothetical protein [Nocardia seriolae]BEK85154.1 hypothetical protein NSERKGN1266_11050 [Nocardia seriolae]BEK99006.1 hypothetical protein NSER024013_69120 [Nocardia seriolae]GAM47720.1 hypothetical protein NS07_v2contig00056-0028 [Nocardia seriolae]GAP29580.1 hypothetical protein NSK11_contig00059-0025 [Nocardia seriolae]GEM25203.1 hypothetical protein NS2_34420 [Nocardia seriolae NBRC 15557]
MGVRIKSTGISRDTDTFSIVELSGRAAKAAMASAGIEPGQVGVMINAGIFRDSNTVEPAVSALIQKAAGIGLDYVKEGPAVVLLRSDERGHGRAQRGAGGAGGAGHRERRACADRVR